MRPTAAQLLGLQSLRHPLECYLDGLAAAVQDGVAWRDTSIGPHDIMPLHRTLPTAGGAQSEESQQRQDEKIYIYSTDS